MELQAQHTDSTAPKGSVAVFDNLSYEVKNKQGVARLVDNVSVKVGQGQVSATTSCHVVDER